MIKGIIRLCYKRVIDSNSTKRWDKMIFEDSYKEYFMQIQYFDQANQYDTFKEFRKNSEKAEQLHYLVSTSIVGYIKALTFVPEIVNNNNELCLPFTKFKFEIMDSSRANKSLHKVAISFYSEPLTWIDTIDNQLLIAHGDQRTALKEGKEIETLLIPIAPNMSISHFQL